MRRYSKEIQFPQSSTIFHNFPQFFSRKVKTIFSCRKPHVGEEAEKDFIHLDTSLNTLQLRALELNMVDFKTYSVKYEN
jgi:hypothetical protein